mmetsp:Transcript_57247/g.83684  ORF Transcript_57247/g.83684 Transcript_57247/m.83684 type:complete len:128 (+) Transcript_57247:1-384(+)
MVLLAKMKFQSTNAFLHASSAHSHQSVFRIQTQAVQMGIKETEIPLTQFGVGDEVRVLDDIIIEGKGINTVGMEGTITFIWERCAEDQICCCSELAFDAPITVKFEDGIEYYYAENELQLKCGSTQA